MAEDSTTTEPKPGAEDWQHWGMVMARANQLMLEAWADNIAKGSALPGFGFGKAAAPQAADPMHWMSAGAEMWSKGLDAWGKMLGQASDAGNARDRRFGGEAWDDPLFDTVKQSYLAISDRLLGTVEEIEGIDEDARGRLRFATRNLLDAMSPANFLATNPEVMKRTIESRGENLLSGLKNMIADIQRGQVTQSPDGAFELGRNLATTPG